MNAAPNILRTIDDPDELHAAASGTSLTINRLSAARKPSHLGQLRGAWWALDIANLQARIEAHGQMGPELGALVFVQKGNESTICGAPLEDGTILILPSSTTLHANIYPGLKYVALVLSTSAWIDAQITSSGSCMRSTPDNVRALRTADSVDMSGRLSQLISDIEDLRSAGIDPAPDITTFASDAACLMAAGGQLPSFDRFFRARHMHVKVARDFIHANAHRRIEITELCRAIGISRRQLEYSFRASLGVSPRDYMSKTQLNEIRRALKKARGTDASVTGIALDHGVRHLSRFSQSYRRLFDEFPSETLGRHASGCPRPLERAVDSETS